MQTNNCPLKNHTHHKRPRLPVMTALTALTISRNGTDRNGPEHLTISRNGTDGTVQ